MPELPARFCDICGAIHPPPIHDLKTCYPGKHGGRIYFSAIDPGHWPTTEDIQAGVRYWDDVFKDKGDKPLS